MSIVAVVMIFALTACNNNTEDAIAPVQTEEPAEIEAPPEPTPEPTPEPVEEQEEEPTEPEPETPDAGAVMDTAEYVAAMNEFIEAFEDLTDFLFELIELLDYLETEEDLLEWIYAFEIIKEAVGESVTELTETAPYAPDEYMDSHILIATAVYLVYESMLDLDFALAAAIIGDYDAFYDGIEDFIINFVAAALVWADAVHPDAAQTADTGEHPLVGAWDWMDIPYYVFEADGRGSMEGYDIVWWTVGGILSICITPVDCGAWYNCSAPISWYYFYDGSELVLVSTEDADFAFAYTRR